MIHLLFLCVTARNTVYLNFLAALEVMMNTDYSDRVVQQLNILVLGVFLVVFNLAILNVGLRGKGVSESCRR